MSQTALCVHPEPSCSLQALLNPLLNPLLNCCCGCCCTLSYQAPPLSTEHDELPSSPAAAHAEPASAAAAALQMPHAMRAPQLPSSLRPAAILPGSPNTLLPPPIAAPTEAHPKVIIVVAAAQVHNVACSVCLPLFLLHPLRECIICVLQLLHYSSGIPSLELIWVQLPPQPVLRSFDIKPRCERCLAKAENGENGPQIAPSSRFTQESTCGLL